MNIGDRSVVYVTSVGVDSIRLTNWPAAANITVAQKLYDHPKYKEDWAIWVKDMEGQITVGDILVLELIDIKSKKSFDRYLFKQVIEEDN